MGALVVNALGSGSGQIVDAAVGKDIADKPAAIKAGAWTGTAPDIREPQIFFRFCDKSGKVRVCQCFARNVVILPGAFVGVDVIPEQVRLVALHGQGCGIPFLLFLRQPLQFYPQAIKREQELIAALETDIKHLEAHTPADKEHFSMTVLGQTYTERKEAGQAIINAYDQLKDLSDKVELGEYRGFPMTLWVSDSGFSQKLQITLKHELSHNLEPGSDPSGNITRIDNALDSMKENLQKHQAELANLLQQTEDAKVEVKRPFPQEAELAEKSNRLNVLNVALNIGGKDAPKDRERQRHDGKTSIKRLLRRMGVESAASASAPKKENDLEVAI